MTDIINIILTNLEQVGIGAALFLAVYLANIGLGIWNSVKIEGFTFDWKKIGNSIVKFILLGASIALLSVAVSVIPAYATYVGFQIEADTLETIDALVIIGSFLTATLRYAADAVSKVKTILGIGTSN